jgi:hypothetical protein
VSVCGRVEGFVRVDWVRVCTLRIVYCTSDIRGFDKGVATLNLSSDGEFALHGCRGQGAGKEVSCYVSVRYNNFQCGR